MAIPDFQSVMLPLMTFANDGCEHSLRQAIEVLAAQFQLTETERKDLLPSGRQATFDNRVGWARTYLSKAGLLTQVGRGKFLISPRGREVMASNPLMVNTAFLKQFKEFEEFQNPLPLAQETLPMQDVFPKILLPADHSEKYTPEESLESSYLNLRRTMAQELLERVMMCSAQFFERLVVDMLVAMGYGGSRKDAGQAVGQSGDGGIDGIIKEDKLGLDIVHIQAKRWKDTVGRPIVQAFAGSLEGVRARKGVLITTSQFSPEAKTYVTQIEKKIVLIDGQQLTQYMLDYGIGVSEVATYVVKRIDLDYFADGQ